MKIRMYGFVGTNKEFVEYLKNLKEFKEMEEA